MKRLIFPNFVHLIFLVVSTFNSAKAFGMEAKLGASSPPKKSGLSTQNANEAKQRALMAEATSALGETQSALKALDLGKNKEALQALERATGKLELILARDPKLALAPAEVIVTTQDVVGDVASLHTIRRQAQDAVLSGRLQDARHLLQSLASETVISVTNIPLASYPTALKAAARLVDDDKIEEAKEALRLALNTLAVKNTIIPLPVVASQKSIEEAERLAQKKDRTADENKRLTGFLATAKVQLNRAEELGYGTKRDFKDLYAQLKDVEGKTDNGKSPSGIFSKVKDSVARLLTSVEEDTPVVLPNTKFN